MNRSADNIRWSTGGPLKRGWVRTALVVLLFSGTGLAAQEDPDAEGDPGENRTTASGVFTEIQATRGEDIFYNVCAECHFEEDFGGAFVESWAGATVKTLFEEIVATMPEDNPGGLPVEDYIDVITWIFKLNAAPMGEEELTEEQMESVEIEYAPPPARRPRR